MNRQKLKNVNGETLHELNFLDIAVIFNKQTRTINTNLYCKTRLFTTQKYTPFTYGNSQYTKQLSKENCSVCFLVQLQLKND